MNFAQRQIQIWKSLRSLPLWVQIWVLGILVPVNGAAFFLTQWPTGEAAAWAAAFVVATNMPIMYAYGGMTKLMSIPHLFAWFPLEYYAIARLGSAAGGELVYAWLVIGVNGISLVFDVMDSWRWLRGDRAVARA